MPWVRTWVGVGLASTGSAHWRRPTLGWCIGTRHRGWGHGEGPEGDAEGTRAGEGCKGLQRDTGCGRQLGVRAGGDQTEGAGGGRTAGPQGRGQASLSLKQELQPHAEFKY